jgi:hypothetical protein
MIFASRKRVRPVGSYTGEARDHEGMLMAEKNHSVPLPPSNGETEETDDESEDGVDLAATLAENLAEKRASEANLAAYVVSVVEHRMARATRPKRNAYRGRKPSPPTRPVDWKGDVRRDLHRCREASCGHDA